MPTPFAIDGVLCVLVPMGQATDTASKVSIANAQCALTIIRVFMSSKLSDVAKEHAATVLSSLASDLNGVDAGVRIVNQKAMFEGIAPLVALLSEGSAGAKRHAARKHAMQVL